MFSQFKKAEQNYFKVKESDSLVLKANNQLKGFSLVQYFKDTATFYQINKKQLLTEILCGLTVGIMQIPESIAFSFVANLPPQVGLYSTFILGVLTSIFGGKPAMISGAAGAMAVVVKEITSSTGELQDDYNKADRFQNVLWTCIILGIFQMLLGFVQISKLMHLIPESAMIGFMNALGIIIFWSQNATYMTCNKDLFLDCETPQLNWMGSLDIFYTLLMVFGTILVIQVLFFLKVQKAIPPAFISIVLMTLVEHLFVRPYTGFKNRTIEETAEIDGKIQDAMGIPTFDRDRLSIPTIIYYSVVLALVGIVESLLTLEALLQIQNQVQSTFQSNRECVAQGIANLATGFFGGMGGDAMIGQSTINIQNGARGRISSFIGGIFILFVLIFLSNVIQYIPIACLTGVLYNVVYNTFNWSTFKIIFQKQTQYFQMIIIIIVTGVAVYTNLAVGIVIGVALSSLESSYNNGQQIDIKYSVMIDKRNDQERKVFYMESPLFFASVRNFQSLLFFDRSPIIVLDFKQSSIVDFSALNSLNQLYKTSLQHGQKIYLQNLNSDSKEIYEKAKNYFKYNYQIINESDNLLQDKNNIREKQAEVQTNNANQEIITKDNLVEKNQSQVVETVQSSEINDLEESPS